MAVTISQLRKAGFGAVPTPPQRLILSAYAKEKHGKSNFALTAPPPIGYIDIDDGVSEIRNKFPHLNDDNLLHFPVQYDGEDDSLAEKSVDKVHKAFDLCVDAPLSVVRTIVMDTDTEWWEMIRLARFGRVDDVPPGKFGPVNREYLQIIKQAKASNKNLILLHQMKEEWLSPPGRNNQGKKKMAQWTGNWIRDCMKKAPYAVQASIYLYKDEFGYNARIAQCRQNPLAEGEILTTDMEELQSGEGLNMCSFPWVAMTIFPDTELGDWQ